MNAHDVASTLLRTLGGHEVTLRAVTSPGDEFGGAPATIDAPLAPALVRREKAQLELLVTAQTLDVAARQAGFTNACALLNATTLVLCGEAKYRVSSHGAEFAHGSAFLYRVSLA